jgi:tetratricopeptide (TPR) repeat protein
MDDEERLKLKVEEWTLWVRENIDTKKEIPAVTEIAVTGLWNQEIEDLFSSGWTADFRTKLLSAFEHVLSRDPIDISPRFVALHLYNSLAKLPKESVGGLMPEDELDSTLAGYRRDLSYLVRLVSPEMCPSEWKFVSWEILNSYLTEDWDRAFALYGKAEAVGILARDHVRLLIGQFKFLLAVVNEVQDPNLQVPLDSLGWKPRIYDLKEREDVFSWLVLFGYCLIDRDADRPLTDFQKDNLREATIDLERALGKLPELSLVYHAMLARCYFSTKHFSDAANQYRLALETLEAATSGGEPHWTLLEGEPTARVYKSLAISQERAGIPGEAENTLKKCKERFPDKADLYLRLAELQARETRFEAVVETVREATERMSEF